MSEEWLFSGTSDWVNLTSSNVSPGPPQHLRCAPGIVAVVPADSEKSFSVNGKSAMTQVRHFRGAGRYRGTVEGRNAVRVAGKELLKGELNGQPVTQAEGESLCGSPAVPCPPRSLSGSGRRQHGRFGQNRQSQFPEQALKTRIGMKGKSVRLIEGISAKPEEPPGFLLVVFNIRNNTICISQLREPGNNTASPDLSNTSFENG